MADEMDGAPPAPKDAARPDGQADPNSKRSDEPLRNLGEVVELKRDVRNVERMLKEQIIPALAGVRVQQPPPGKADKDGSPAGADALAEVAKLRGELELRDALADRGVTDAKQRRALERLYRAEAPPDVRAWLESTADYFDAAKPPAVPSPAIKATESAPEASPPIPAGKSNTGAPGADNRALLPNDVLSANPEMLRGMKREERKAWFERVVSGGAMASHPVWRRR